jgi:hypothetical protein
MLGSMDVVNQYVEQTDTPLYTGTVSITGKNGQGISYAIDLYRTPIEPAQTGEVTVEVKP